MSPFHLALALMVVVVWGVNFVVMTVALHGFSPLLLCVARFSLVAFPAVFFLPRPKAPWKLIAAFGLANFALQFAFMFTGIKIGMPPGLASLVMQAQAIFTMGLASFIFRERPSSYKLIGAAISFSGICLVAYSSMGTPVISGIVLTLLAALSWASGNIISKKIRATSPLSLVVWGNLMALPPILLLTLIVEGPSQISNSILNIEWPTVGAIAYLVFLSTIFSYSVWGFLLNRYPSATVAPFSLLIPVVGFVSAAVFLGEELSPWKIQASLLVVTGLAINVFEGKIRRVLS